MTVGSLSSSRSWQKGFQLLIVQHYVGYRSVKNSFYYVEMFPPHLLWWESMLFLHLFEMTAWSFLLLMWFITLTDSHVLNHPRDSGTNPSWLQHMIFYICCWIWLANIVLRVFHLFVCFFSFHLFSLIFPSLSRVRLFATPWTVAYQAPPSMGFSRQEYWSGLPFPSPRVFHLNSSKILAGHHFWYWPGFVSGWWYIHRLTLEETLWCFLPSAFWKSMRRINIRSSYVWQNSPSEAICFHGAFFFFNFYWKFLLYRKWISYIIYTHKCCCCRLVSSVVSNSVQPYGLQPARLLCPWDSLGKSTGVGCHSPLLQVIFPTQGLNPGVLHSRQILYCWPTREAHIYTYTHTFFLKFPSYLSHHNNALNSLCHTVGSHQLSILHIWREFLNYRFCFTSSDWSIQIMLPFDSVLMGCYS